MNFTKTSSRLEKSIKKLSVGWYVRNKKGFFFDCNDIFAKFVGFDTRKSLINKPIKNLAKKKLIHFFLQKDNLVVKNLVSIQFEKKLAKNVKPQIFKFIKIPIKYVSKNDPYLLGLVIPLSIFTDELSRLHEIIDNFILNQNHFKNKLKIDRKQIAQLKKAKNYLNNILDHLPGYIYWKDKNGAILGDNELHAKLLGFSKPEEVIGKTDYDFSWQNQADEMRKNDIEVMRTGKLKTIEEYGVLPNGQKVIGLTHKAPLRNENKKIIGVIGISTDITELKKAEEELHAAKIREQVQEEKIKTIQSLGGAVAHELRTPLRSVALISHGIMNFLQRLIEGYQLACNANLISECIQPRNLLRLEDGLKSIEQEIDFANTIIDMLLMNIKALKIDPSEFEKCSMAQTVTDALSRYPFTEDEKAIIHCDNKNDFIFTGKKLLIIHILFNLIKNSLYYITKAQKGEITIWLEPGKKNNKLHFKDTGTGIPTDILPRIFNHFFSTTHGGTGIGLSFCKMVMEGLGGNIVCESKEGEFTKFILSFPVVQK